MTLMKEAGFLAEVRGTMPRAGRRPARCFIRGPCSKRCRQSVPHERQTEPARRRAGGISTRSVEIVVAVILFALGSLVVFDSLRLGSSWGDDGPRPATSRSTSGSSSALERGDLRRGALAAERSQTQGLRRLATLRRSSSVLLPALVLHARDPAHRHLRRFGDLYRGLHALARASTAG